MSEYQYYEFHAIDRPLTERQMRELRAISSRAAISRTRFSNHYTFGDLKADPRELLATYFDASLYFANWHFVELAFRFPTSVVDVKSLRRYRAGRSLEVYSKGANIVVAISVERDDFDAADDGQGWLSSLIALRTNIASGDERALYLAWLLGVQQGEIDDRATEPAPPDHLGTLSAALESFSDIMGVDRDLVVVAAEGGMQASSVPPEREIDQWIASLEEHKKVALLGRVARGEPGVGAELLRRFRWERTARKPETRRLRTAGALRARAAELAEQRRADILAREAKERVVREREQVVARARYLNRLAKRELHAWRQIHALVATRRPGDYDAAITLLKDLRELGERKGRSADVTRRIRALREAQATKPSFLERLRRAGL